MQKTWVKYEKVVHPNLSLKSKTSFGKLNNCYLNLGKEMTKNTFTNAVKKFNHQSKLETLQKFGSECLNILNPATS